MWAHRCKRNVLCRFPSLYLCVNSWSGYNMKQWVIFESLCWKCNTKRLFHSVLWVMMFNNAFLIHAAPFHCLFLTHSRLEMISGHVNLHKCKKNSFCRSWAMAKQCVLKLNCPCWQIFCEKYQQESA